MIGYIEWTSKERDETERANITRCVGEQGVYRIEFSSEEMWSEGRMEISVGSDEQHTRGMYMFTNGAYKGDANVVGRTTKHDGMVTFTGRWHDPKDTTGEWEVYAEFEEPKDHTYTFTYEEANPSA